MCVCVLSYFIVELASVISMQYVLYVALCTNICLVSIEMTYYVVFEGRVPGIYEEWEDCKKQVHKFSDNCYKRYATREEAEAKWRNYRSRKNKNKMKTAVVLMLLLTIVAALLYFIIV